MIKRSKFLFVLAALAAILISACGGAAGTDESSVGGDKPRASLVEFTGVIEAMDGNQWTVNGQVLTVDPSVLQDGPFQIGDTVKIEAEVQADGSVVVTRVEPPAGVDDNANGNDNSSVDNGNSSVNENTNDNTNSSLENSNDDNSNDDDLDDDNSNGDDDLDDDSNSNGDDDSDDDSNSNGDDDSDDDNSNGDDDEDDDSNSNGDDDSDDDNSNGDDSDD